MPRMTKEKRDSLLEEYCQGAPVAALAEKYDVAESYPCQLASRRGVPRRLSSESRAIMAESARQRVPTYDLSDKTAPVVRTFSTAEIRRLAELGKKRTEIAALLRCSYSEIAAVLD